MALSEFLIFGIIKIVKDDFSISFTHQKVICIMNLSKIYIRTIGYLMSFKRLIQVIKYSKRLRKIFYVIRSQNQVVGYSIYYIQPELSFKGLKKKSVNCSIAIDKKFRGRGYANRLLHESIQEMRLNKIESVLLHVNANDVPAIKLYEKLGFRITKETKNICDQFERCYEMELNLTDGDIHLQKVLAQVENREEIAEAIAVAMIAGSSQLGLTNIYGEQVYGLILER